MKVKEQGKKSGFKLNIQKMKIMTFSPILHSSRWGENRNSDRLYFLGLQKSLQLLTATMKLEDSCFLEGRPQQT